MKFAYDNITDSVLVFARKPSEQVKGSATVANLVLDFTKESKIVGLEIRKATEFFKALGIKEPPNTIQSATLEVNYRRDGFVIVVQLKFEDQKERSLPIFISSESPQLAIT